MAARAIWKGTLQIGRIALPVKLYSGAVERLVHFRMLASGRAGAKARRREPVEQHMVDPHTGDTVEYSEIQRGYQVPEGFVILKREELAKLEPKASRDIELTAFVSPLKLSPEWFVRPYVLAPDGHSETYFALVKALRESGREGLARWTMRKIEYHGVLRAEGDYLMLVTLRHSEELEGSQGLKAPEGRGLTEKERKMALQLIEAFSGPFDPATLRDSHREKLLALVEAKARGKKPRLHAPVSKAASSDLEAALGRSLKAAGTSRGAAHEPSHRKEKRSA